MLGKRDAEFTFDCIWPLPAKVSFPHLQKELASRTRLASSSVLWPRPSSVPSFCRWSGSCCLCATFTALCGSLLKHRKPLPVQEKKDSSKLNQKSELMASWLAQFMLLQHKYELEQWSYGHFNFYWRVQKWIWLKERQMRQVQIL